MKIIKYSVLFTVMTLVSSSNSVKINDEFKIEYLEMFSSISLHNEHQGFVGNVTEAYWNNDSLVVSGETGCFLIEFGKTKYNDEMIRIECGNLSHKLKKGTIRKFMITE